MVVMSSENLIKIYGHRECVLCIVGGSFSLIRLRSTFLLQGASSQFEQINPIMTKLVSCHGFTGGAPAVHLGKEGACICLGSDRIKAPHKTSNNVWFVAF